MALYFEHELEEEGDENEHSEVQVLHTLDFGL
jgi:hypothetical protein